MRHPVKRKESGRVGMMWKEVMMRRLESIMRDAGRGCATTTKRWMSWSDAGTRDDAAFNGKMCSHLLLPRATLCAGE